jgi:MFS family permease
MIPDGFNIAFLKSSFRLPSRGIIFDRRHPWLRIPTFSDLRGVVEDTLKASIVAQFPCSLAFGLIGSFMPLFINHDLGESLVNATYWTGVSNLAWYGGSAFTAPVWGWVCDRVGTRKVLVIVLFGNIATYAGIAFSQNVT